MRIITLILIVCSMQTFAQLTGSKQKVIYHSDSLRNAMPREKIYLHSDKATYLSTDTIWFKAYLTNASTHLYSQISALVYVDLISEQGEVMNTLALPTALGITWGNFALNTDSYKTGKYILRGYTKWAQNFGDSHIFKKNIAIINREDEQSVLETSSIALSTSSVTQQKETETDIQFLPEGGKWLVGVTQKIAFKAVGKDGNSTEINGVIYDSNENKITDFYSNAKGMGFFNINAKDDTKYIAKISSKSGIIKEQRLASPLETGTALAIDHAFGSDSLTIRVFSTLPYQDFMLIGQTRGMICYLSNVKSRIIKIPKSVFPSGVTQIILTNKENQKLNERSVFINHQQDLKIDLSANSSFYKTRDSVSIHLKVKDHLKIPSQGTFSVAVTDDAQVKKDSSEGNILSYFLLSSDLKGEIENPNDYFSMQDSIKHQALEALLLTQGWVSYDWDATKKPAHRPEKEYTISGRVSNILAKPSEKARIILFGSNKSVLFMDTVSNKNGEFVFDNMPILDSASLVLQLRNSKGKLGTLTFDINEFTRPTIPIIKQSREQSFLDVDSNEARMLENQKLEDLAVSGIRLKEVKIIGKRTVKGLKNINGTVIQTISEQELNKIAKVNLYQALQEKIRGFGRRRSGYSVHISPAKFIFDGMHVEEIFAASGSRDEIMFFLQTSLDYYSAEDIKSIDYVEVITKDGPIAYIEINTHTGAGPFLNKSANMYLLKPINYGSTATFYSPKYSSANKNNKKPDYRSTIYWAPHLLTDQNGNADFSFFSADKPGTYTVWIEGSDMQGKFGMQTMKLEIK